MAELKQYLDILVDSLERKKQLLVVIKDLTLEQTEILKQEDCLAAFDENVLKKGTEVRKLEKLDKGFDSIFERIRDRLEQDKASYKTEIHRLQELIREISEIGVSIQAAEERNRVRVEEYFSYQRRRNTESKRSVQAASRYYRSMSGMDYPMDSKIDHKQ